MLSGQNASKFAAGCDYMLYHRSFQQTTTSPLQWEIRTKKFSNYAAGGRDEGRLPDPLGYLMSDEAGKDLFVPDCTYRTLAEALGIIQTPVAAATVGNVKADEAVATSTAANGKGATQNRPTPPTATQPGRSTSR